MKTASTNQIIEKLKGYEKENGIGAVHSIGSVCSGDRNIEYIFRIEDKNGKESEVEIESVQKDTVWKNETNSGREMTAAEYKQQVLNLLKICLIETLATAEEDELQDEELEMNQSYCEGLEDAISKVMSLDTTINE